MQTKIHSRANRDCLIINMMVSITQNQNEAIRSLCRADRFSVSNRQRRIDMKKRSGATVVYMGDERLV
ncbi:hypothetical protein ACOME3_000569 [Neoechinorhynchus agilis]